MLGRLMLLLAAGVLWAGCGALAEAPPHASPAQQAPAVTPDAPAAKGIARVELPTLSQDSFTREATQITVRVRNLTCQGVARGSGFAIDRHTLVTNRHVVAGAERLEVDTADGTTLKVSTARVGVLGDVAFVTVDGVLPVSANLSGKADQGEDIAAVGYPLGGPLTITQGIVIDRIDGSRFHVQGNILRISAEVQPGNSGGPLLDRKGHVAGVVYAIEVATGLGLAIPMDTVNTLIDEAGFEAVPACGAE
jgi:S1-C subfamily serine protease